MSAHPPACSLVGASASDMRGKVNNILIYLQCFMDKIARRVYFKYIHWAQWLLVRSISWKKFPVIGNFIIFAPDKMQNA